jgi:hypothetical protein
MFIHCFRIENIFQLLYIMSNIHNKYNVNIDDILEIWIDFNCKWFELSNLEQNFLLLAFLEFRKKFER